MLLRKGVFGWPGRSTPKSVTREDEMKREDGDEKRRSLKDCTCEVMDVFMVKFLVCPI